MRIFTTGLILLGVASTVACATEVADGDAGTGGSATGGGVGTGGTVGVGGTTGVGGTVGAGGTVAGAGGSVSAACTVAGTTNAVIADFAAAATPTEIDGRKGVFVTTPAGGTTTVTDGALVAETTTGSWATTGTTIADGACYDVSASGYTGFKFTISSPTNTSIKFALTTKETSGTDAGGTCATSCSDHPAKVVTVSSSATDICVPFSELVAGGWGTAPLPTPQNHILGLAWGVVEETEALDLTLDNITFVSSCP